jgi:hypothetical protein
MGIAMRHSGHDPAPDRPASLLGVTVLERTYDLPSEDELAMLVGAAVPHFALQIRDRVAAYAATLPAGHPRQPELARHLARLDALAVDGQAGSGTPELPTRASLTLGTADPH